MVCLLEETRAAQDRKIIGGVEIKRGAVDVAAPLASARTSLQLAFGSYLLLATLIR